MSDRKSATQPVRSDDPRSELRDELTNAVRQRAAGFADLIAAFLFGAGLTQAEINEVLLGCASRAQLREPSLSVDPWTSWAQVSEAVCDWWRQAQYVAPDGTPIPLEESGPAPSVDALLSLHVDAAHLTEAKAILRRCVEITAEGRWRFSFSAPALPLRGDEGVHRLQVSLTGLLRTFLENYVSNAPPARKNFETSAGSVSFPESMLPAFRVQMHKRLQATIDDVDAWITHHAAQGAPGPVSEIGVEVFVYSFPPRDRGAVRRVRRRKT